MPNFLVINLILALIGFAIPSAMPSRRWLFGFCIVIGAPVAFVVLREMHVRSQPGFDGTPFDLLGVGIMFAFALPLVIGIVTRAVTLTYDWAPPIKFLVHVIIFLMMIGIPAAFIAK